MSFADAFRKNPPPHVDTPAQAEARAKAVSEIQAKADARAARATAHKTHGEPEKVAPAGAGPPEAKPSQP